MSSGVRSIGKHFCKNKIERMCGAERKLALFLSWNAEMPRARIFVFSGMVVAVSLCLAASAGVTVRLYLMYGASKEKPSCAESLSSTVHAVSSSDSIAIGTRFVLTS